MPTATAPISALELRALLADQPDIRVLDVRTGGEFESVHIPGSYNVPLDTLAEHAREFASVEGPIVLVCQSGARATTAQDKLNAAGCGELRVLDGGIGSWLVAEGDVVRGPEKWLLERQVRAVAGGIVLTSILGSLVFPKMKWLAGAIGGGLLFAALSNTCAMGNLLSRLPYNRGARCDVDAVVRDLRSSSPRAA